MFTHAPVDYVCPFCALVAGKEDAYSSQNDIVYRDDYTVAFIAPKWWPNNPGGVLVIPKVHYENIYVTPENIAGDMYKTVKRISIALRKSYDCMGTSNRQHNEPAGRQNVWHVHVHVLPRYEGDRLYQLHDQSRFTEARERAVYAEKLRTYFMENPI